MGEFERARKHMVDNQLRTSGITDWRILGVMSDVPRELFVPEERRAVAYSDHDQPIGGAGTRRYLAAAAPFAKLIQLAGIGPLDTVLDVGAGTGYSTAVLAGLAQHVTGLESDATLANAATANLTALGISNAKVVVGPLERGVNDSFSVIVLEGVVDCVPSTLLDLLADGGRLVALIADGGQPAVANVFVRTGAEVAARAEFNANLPPLGINSRETEFVF